MSRMTGDDDLPEGYRAAGPAGPWVVERGVLWGWVAAALQDVHAAALDARGLRALCSQALDTCAPALLVHAQAAGILLEYLLAGAIVEAYVDLYGQPQEAFEVARLHRVVRRLESGRRLSHM